MTFYVNRREDMKDIVMNWGEDFLVAVTDDGKEIMGTLTWRKMDPGTLTFDGRLIENTAYELFSLVVPVEYRRSGVARKLCELALDKAKADKADIYLGKFTRPPNNPSDWPRPYIISRNKFRANRSTKVLRTTRISKSSF